MRVLRQSLPLLATSFVNKCGTIGLSLLPVLLVERHVSTAHAALVMALVKAAGLVGLLLGGVLVDRLGARVGVLCAFLLQGLGLGLLPVAPTLVLVTVCAVLARVGDSLYHSPARLLLTEWVEPAGQQESIGWLRTANNAGQVVSYSLGVLFAGFGVAPLMLLDSCTSLVALGVGSRLLRTPAHARAHHDQTPAPQGAGLRPWWPAILCAVANGCFLFQYEIFLVGGAATFRERFGEEGLRLFSTSMVINTLLCAGVAVWAARFFRRPSVALTLGGALSALGTAVALHHSAPRALIFAGVFAITLGEIVLASLSSVTLLRLLPGGKRKGAKYGGLLVLQECGRIAGGAASFPLVVRGSHGTLVIALAGAATMVVSLWAGRLAERVLAPPPAPIPTPVPAAA